jgi:GNAT superfamily N-acetyltransferase
VIEIRRLSGADIGPWLPAVAQLRMRVFRDFPYLYDGDLDYEQRYLAAYARSPRSVFVLALDGGRVVGASTGLPLADDDDAFQAPFRAAGIAVDSVIYFGESVLLPEYRGQGLGHRFFDEREAHAAGFGDVDLTAFAAVDRAADDPRRPPGHRDNDTFWRKRGYARRPDLRMRLAWKELGEAAESEKTLTFWLRPLAG